MDSADQVPVGGLSRSRDVVGQPEHAPARTERHREVAGLEEARMKLGAFIVDEPDSAGGQQVLSGQMSPGEKTSYCPGRRIDATSARSTPRPGGAVIFSPASSAGISPSLRRSQ